jgi:TolA-binding protein
MRRLWGLFLATVMLAWTGNAYASADSTCYPDWKILQTDYNGCSGTALLSPGNDTRVNLLMLLHDFHGEVGPASKYAYEIPERRGEAEPFDWASFASKLGPSPAGAENDETGNFPFGTRCMSNMAAGAEYIAAVSAAKGLLKDEKATLTAVRTALKPECSSDTGAAETARSALAGIRSKAGRAFAAYLIGAAAFYDGNFDEARMMFSEIGKTESGWLTEAASYMIGRALLNQSMQGAFDEYGSLLETNPNSELLDAAEDALGTYLKTYPRDRFTDSARGLLRRIFWLGNDNTRLTAAYAALFRQQRPAALSFPDLVQEIDIKLLGELKPEDVRDPMLLAVLNLRAMRHADDPKFADYGTPPISRAALDAQRSRFAGNDALFTYLQAAHALYVAKKPADVLRLIPAGKAGGSYLDFSRQLLRAVALDAAGDPAARAALFALIAAAKKPHQRGSAELALALHDERARAVDNIFATNSAIRDPDIREILLRSHAGPALLRQQAIKAASGREQQVAIFTLLYKDVTRGAYADFLRDLSLIPANARPRPADDYQTPHYTDIALFRWAGSKDYACPALKTVATTLSAKPKDPQGLLCLGEFIRTSGLDPDYYGVTHYLDELPDADELGGTPSLFPGKRFSRLDGYKTVMADRTALPDQRAYALYRAINCYAPAGYNGCDATEAPQSQRKAWFEQLKGQYPTSVWAKKLRYYW